MFIGLEHQLNRSLSLSPPSLSTVLLLQLSYLRTLSEINCDFLSTLLVIKQSGDWAEMSGYCFVFVVRWGGRYWSMERRLLCNYYFVECKKSFFPCTMHIITFPSQTRKGVGGVYIRSDSDRFGYQNLVSWWFESSQPQTVDHSGLSYRRKHDA